MPRFLVLYRSTMTAAEQMAQSTPEQAEAGMAAWMAWAQRAGDAVIDLGAPLQASDDGATEGAPVAGYSILQAQSSQTLRQILEDHPHQAMGGTIEILEMLPMPGM